MPSPDCDHVVLRIEPDEIRPVPDGGEAGRGRARPLLLFGVEPPEVAVIGTMLARLHRFLEPRRGHEALAAPAPLIEDEEAEARHVLAAHPQAAAPPRSAADR